MVSALLCVNIVVVSVVQISSACFLNRGDRLRSPATRRDGENRVSIIIDVVEPTVSTFFCPLLPFVVGCTFSLSSESAFGSVLSEMNCPIWCSGI